MWNYRPYVGTIRVKGDGVNAQPGEGRKYEMRESKRTTICGI
jgi:hypothetical protein